MAESQLSYAQTKNDAMIGNMMYLADSDLVGVKQCSYRLLSCTCYKYISSLPVWQLSYLVWRRTQIVAASWPWLAAIYYMSESSRLLNKVILTVVCNSCHYRRLVAVILAQLAFLVFLRCVQSRSKTKVRRLLAGPPSPRISTGLPCDCDRVWFIIKESAGG